VGEPFLRDVGHPALTVRIGTACKALRGDDATQDIARAVTLGAMPETVDEIGPAIEAFGARGVGYERLADLEQQLPDSDVEANVERKRHVVNAQLARHGGKRLQIGKEIADVLHSGALIGGVGKGRKIMLTRRGDSLHERVDKAGLAPAP